MRRTLSVALVATLVLVSFGAFASSSRASQEKELKAFIVEKLGDDAKGINVTLVDTKATLTGQVTRRPTQELCKEVALAFPGVTRASNEVTLKKEEGVEQTLKSEFADGELEGRVKSTLTTEMGKRGWDLEVEAVEDTVSLRGTVPDKERKDLALRLTRETSGVKHVIDLITVKAAK